MLSRLLKGKKSKKEANNSSRLVESQASSQEATIAVARSSLPKDWGKRGSRTIKRSSSKKSTDEPQSPTNDLIHLYDNSDANFENFENPDADIQLEQDQNDFKVFDLPSDSPSPSNKKVQNRLSMKIPRHSIIKKPESVIVKKSEVDVEPQPVTESKLDVNKKWGVRNSLKFLTSTTPEKSRRKELKLEATRLAKEQKRRLERILKDPWYPAKVNFRKPMKSSWVPFFGNEHTTYFDTSAILRTIPLEQNYN